MELISESRMLTKKWLYRNMFASRTRKSSILALGHFLRYSDARTGRDRGRRLLAGRERVEEFMHICQYH